MPHLQGRTVLPLRRLSRARASATRRLSSEEELLLGRQAPWQQVDCPRAAVRQVGSSPQQQSLLRCFRPRQVSPLTSGDDCRTHFRVLQKRRIAGNLIHVLMVATCDESIQCWVRPRQLLRINSGCKCSRFKWQSLM